MLSVVLMREKIASVTASGSDADRLYMAMIKSGVIPQEIVEMDREAHRVGKNISEEGVSSRHYSVDINPDIRRIFLQNQEAVIVIDLDAQREVSISPEVYSDPAQIQIVEVLKLLPEDMEVSVRQTGEKSAQRTVDELVGVFDSLSIAKQRILDFAKEGAY